MKQIPQQVSESVRARNPHLYGPVTANEAARLMVTGGHPASVVAGKRVRQTDKPLNKLEQEFSRRLFEERGEALVAGWADVEMPRSQAKRYRLANGAWYKPDFTSSSWPCWDRKSGRCETCWEVKGPKVARWSRRGELTIKFAAAAWPEVRWVLAWKQDGQWKEQEIKP